MPASTLARHLRRNAPGVILADFLKLLAEIVASQKPHCVEIMGVAVRRFQQFVGAFDRRRRRYAAGEQSVIRTELAQKFAATCAPLRQVGPAKARSASSGGIRNMAWPIGIEPEC